MRAPLLLAALWVGVSMAQEPDASLQSGERPADEPWRAALRRQLQPKPHQEPPDPDPFAFSVYQGARPELMGEQTLINGASMKIASLIVNDPPHVVEGAYYDAFEKKGIRPLAGRLPRDPAVRYLSFRAPKSKNLKTVTLIPNGSGTIILASVGNPEELIRPRPKLPGDLPVPPDAVMAASIEQQEPGGSAHTAYFVVRNSTVEQVRDFYRRQLPSRGFTAMPGGDGDAYERPGMSLSMRLTSGSEPHSVAVHMVFVR